MIYKALSAFEQIALQEENVALKQQLGAKQAEIDRLMLEFCPDEMTQDQFDEWARHQRLVKD